MLANIIIQVILTDLLLLFALFPTPPTVQQNMLLNATVLLFGPCSYAVMVQLVSKALSVKTCWLPAVTGNNSMKEIRAFSPKLPELFNLNYTPPEKKEDDLKHWTNLPLQLIGPIATVKIKNLTTNKLPVHNTSITPTDNCFKTLDSLISHLEKQKTQNLTISATKEKIKRWP